MTWLALTALLVTVTQLPGSPAGQESSRPAQVRRARCRIVLRSFTLSQHKEVAPANIAGFHYPESVRH